MNRLIIISVLSIFSFVNISASSIGPFFNPGVYLGWEFGKQHGPVIGFEISGGFMMYGGLAGVVYQKQYNFIYCSFI